MKNYNILQKKLNWNLQYKKQKYRTIKGYCIVDHNAFKRRNDTLPKDRDLKKPYPIGRHMPIKPRGPFLESPDN